MRLAQALPGEQEAAAHTGAHWERQRRDDSGTKLQTGQLAGFGSAEAASGGHALGPAVSQSGSHNGSAH